MDNDELEAKVEVQVDAEMERQKLQSRKGLSERRRAYRQNIKLERCEKRVGGPKRRGA